MSSTKPESPAAEAALLLQAPFSCRTWLPLWLVASAAAAERPRLGSGRKCGGADVVGEADGGRPLPPWFIPPPARGGEFMPEMGKYKFSWSFPRLLSCAKVRFKTECRLRELAHGARGSQKATYFKSSISCLQGEIAVRPAQP